MVDFFRYLFNSSLCIGVFYLMYICLLKNTTFFKANRIFLLSGLLLSLIIPLLHVTISIPVNSAHPVSLHSLKFENYLSDDYYNPQATHNHFFMFNFLMGLYLAGVCFMLIRMGRLLFGIYQLIHNNQSFRKDKIRYVIMDHDSMLFSFFHFLFISKQKISNEYAIQVYLEHEKVHIRGLHTIDLLIAEFIFAFLWFNPFLFFYRHSIKMNHEYLADSSVIRSGIHPAEYLKTLVNEVFNNHFIRMTSNFNDSLTKKRLIMITKIKSTKKASIRFLIILPVVSFLLLAFVNYSIKSSLRLGNKATTLTIQTSSVPSIVPIKNKDIIVTSDFGWRIHPIYKTKAFHPGIDFAAEEGTPILATADGLVELVAENKDSKGEYRGEGKHIMIRHNDEFETHYTHLSNFNVKQGDIVTKGQVIGFVGNTGMCTGPHLHYEVIKNGIKVNPKDYMSAYK